jgi:hypothetical protein
MKRRSVLLGGIMCVCVCVCVCVLSNLIYIYICIYIHIYILLFNSEFSMLILRLADLSIDESAVLMLPTIIVLGSI